jgi:phospholipase C
MKKLFTILAYGMALIAGAWMISAYGASQDKPDQNHFQHLFVIMMENKSYETLIGNPNAPWINNAAVLYGVATKYYGVSHPSQPNYIATTSGSTNGVAGDNDVTLNIRNLVDQLEAAGKSWKSYQQSLSFCGENKLASECGDQLYVRKHNPFVSYLDIQVNPARMAKVVDLTELDSDLTSGNVPDFSWITPDLCNDMHGHQGHSKNDPCNYRNRDQLIFAGDSFLRTWVGKIMASPAWTEKSVIFVTWDESDFSFKGYSQGCCNGEPGGGHLMMVVISHSNPAPRSSSMPYNHYSLLATIEDCWKLGCLANTCSANVPRMVDLVNLP